MMKRLMLTAALVLCHVSLLLAQQADFQQAVARYKKYSQVTAKVTKTTHKNAVAKDVVDKGTLTMKAPSEVGIVIDGGKDQLLMQGSQFTMVIKGKKHTASSENNPQFASFQTVFESILAGGGKDISRLADLTVTKQGQLLVLTITPQAADKKAARRMLFTSFMLTIDSRSSELRSLRMNDRSGYTDYTFSNFKFK